MNQIAPTTETAMPEIGAPFQGGFFAGIMFQQGGSKYALIVAPKTEGEAEEIAFTNGVRSETAACSLHDGQANTQALLEGDHPVAKFCAGLEISGFTDWYLPSKDELYLIASRFLPADDGDNWNPPKTDIEAFKAGNAQAFERDLYWSSTEASADYAWVQYFITGFQTCDFKDYRWRVRAVRKHPL
ncbi:MAG: DUF1566 domain-containing protein [Alphaproteobacteria bacterium]|nr:DUF1566 domain-containing protein [Alphaproteobacteria bacterium]